MSDSHKVPSTMGSKATNNSSSSNNNNNNKVSGVVKFYSVQKCYGFIKRDDTKEYVFVHSKSVSGKNQRRVTRSLAKGEHVEFDVVMSDRSPEAINVTGLNGGPVIGSEYALITMQWHQYNDYKQDLIRNDVAVREQSPRARRFFHRRQPRDFGNRGRGRARHEQNQNKPNDDHDTDEIKPKSRRRRYNRNRRSKQQQQQQQQQNNGNDTDKSDRKSDILLMTESNLTTLLSELNIDNNINTAHSSSSESLDFEKINSDDTNIPCISNLPSSSSASSRLAATFNKGNQ